MKFKKGEIVKGINAGTFMIYDVEPTNFGEVGYMVLEVNPHNHSQTKHKRNRFFLPETSLKSI